MKNFWKKILITATLVMTLALCFAFVGCREKDEESAPTLCETHDWKLISTTATCVSDGIETYKCSICNATGTKNVSKTGKHNFANNACVSCNIPKQPIQLNNIDWYGVNGADDWFSVKGNAKNISSQRLNHIKLYCCLYNDNNEIVGKDDINLVSYTEYVEPAENVGISFLVRNVNLEWTYYIIRIEVPTLDAYQITYKK